ncbi:MAG: hypothetical protein QM766_07075 [Burkholderiaceae bacterium]
METTKRLWEDGALKTIRRKTKLRTAFFESINKVPPEARMVGPEVGTPFLIPVALYQSVFERTVRGLFFFHTARMLAPSTPAEVTMLSGKPLDLLEGEGGAALRVENVGDGALQYYYLIPDPARDLSVWVFGLHGAHWTLVECGSVRGDDAF